jgi:hypothetical protein
MQLLNGYMCYSATSVCAGLQLQRDSTLVLTLVLPLVAVMNKSEHGGVRCALALNNEISYGRMIAQVAAVCNAMRC